jgi:sulfonate transport system permease protein
MATVLAPFDRPASPAGDPGSTPPELVDVGPRRRRRIPRAPRGVRRLGGPALLVLAWWVASATGRLDARTLAPPDVVLGAFGDLIASGALQEHLWASLQRVASGLAIGVSVGVALAVVAGLFRLGEDLLDSTIQVLRSIPVLALTPLLILWLGIGEEPKIAMVAIGTTFPVYINTYAAIRGVDVKLVETGTTFGLRRPGLVRHVILPGAVPGFLVGLRFALAVAWLILVVSEQINATSGVGYLMNDARAQFRTDDLVVGLVIYGVLGLLSHAVVRFLKRTLLVWRRGFTGA